MTIARKDHLGPIISLDDAVVKSYYHLGPRKRPPQPLNRKGQNRRPPLDPLLLEDARTRIDRRAICPERPR